MKTSILIIMVSISFSVYGQVPKTIYKKIGDKTVYDVESKNVFTVNTGFMIDADGSPRAYHKENSKALDYLGNAGKPGNWWALVTEKNGNPVVQSESDPAPGYYISMTSLQDKAKNYKDPNRYVNSEAIPYIVMPSNFSKDYKLGDLALVINKKTNKRYFAIFADIGPKVKIGEGSIFLAEQLGIKGTPKKGGASSDIVYFFIKNSGNKKVLSNKEIQEVGKTKLSEEDIASLLK